MTVPILLAAAAAAAALGCGWLLMRTELRSVGDLRLSPRLVLACLQGMIAAFALVVIVGSAILEPSRAVNEAESTAEAWLLLGRITAAGALGWLPCAFALAILAVRELYSEKESPRLPLPLTAMAIYLAMLVALWANPSFLR